MGLGRSLVHRSWVSRNHQHFVPLTDSLCHRRPPPTSGPLLMMIVCDGDLMIWLPWNLSDDVKKNLLGFPDTKSLGTILAPPRCATLAAHRPTVRILTNRRSLSSHPRPEFGSYSAIFRKIPMVFVQYLALDSSQRQRATDSKVQEPTIH